MRGDIVLPYATRFRACEVEGGVKAMIEAGIRLDYIGVDGAEGGTGAAPVEFANRVGMPLREGLIFVRNALVGGGLKEEIRLAASGKEIGRASCRERVCQYV